jgi:hypothetical protein
LSESFPISLGGGIWEGIVDPSTHVVTLKRQVDKEHPKIEPATLNLPENSNEILAGAGPSWGIKQDKFYQTKSIPPENVQYIDHYSKVLYSFGDHKIYTFPYND